MKKRKKEQYHDYLVVQHVQVDLYAAHITTVREARARKTLRLKKQSIRIKNALITP